MDRRQERLLNQFGSTLGGAECGIKVIGFEVGCGIFIFKHYHVVLNDWWLYMAWMLAATHFKTSHAQSTHFETSQLQYLNLVGCS